MAFTGYWWDGKSDKVYACSDTNKENNVCKGTQENEQQCREGYTGILCSQCEKDYGGFKDGVCNSCGSKGGAAIVLLISITAVVVLIITIVYFSFLPRSEFSHIMRIIVNFIQLSGFISTFRVCAGDVLENFSQVMGLWNSAGSNTFAYRCIWNVNAVSRLKGSTALCCLLLAIIIIRLIFNNLVKKYFKHNDVVNQAKLSSEGDEDNEEDADNADRQQNDKEHDNKSVVISKYSVAQPESGRKNKSSKSSSISSKPSTAPQNRFLCTLIQSAVRFSSFRRVIPICIILFCFFYGSLMEESFHFVKPCWSINGVRYMPIDTTIHCDSQEYINWTVYAWFRIILLGLGLPATCAFIVYQKKDRLFSLRTKKKSVYRFLVDGFRYDAWYWENILMLRKIGIILVAVFLRQDAASQVYAGIIVLSFFLVLQVLVNPYSNPQLNRLESASLFMLLLVQAMSGLSATDIVSGRSGTNENSILSTRESTVVSNRTIVDSATGKD